MTIADQILNLEAVRQAIRDKLATRGTSPATGMTLWQVPGLIDQAVEGDPGEPGDPGDPGGAEAFRSLTTAEISNALNASSEGNLRALPSYTSAESGVTGNLQESGAFMPALAYAVLTGGQASPAYARCQQVLKHIVSGGVEPSGRGGYSLQHAVPPIAMAAILRHTPHWEAMLTSAERARWDTVVLASMVGAAWCGSDTNPYIVAGQAQRDIMGNFNTGRDWNPNYTMAQAPLVVLGATYFGGVAQGKAVLDGFSLSSFVSTAQSQGLTNIVTAFTRNHGANSPTAAQIQTAVTNWKRYDQGLDEWQEIIGGHLYWMFLGTVKRGLNNGAGKNGCGTTVVNATPPNNGVPGMGYELDAWDGGVPGSGVSDQRSMLFHVYSGYRSIMSICLGLAVNGWWDRTHPDLADVMPRVKVGDEDIRWRTFTAGHIDYGYGGCVPNGVWSPNSDAQHWQHARLSLLAIGDAFLRYHDAEVEEPTGPPPAVVRDRIVLHGDSYMDDPYVGKAVMNALAPLLSDEYPFTISAFGSPTGKTSEQQLSEWTVPIRPEFKADDRRQIYVICPATSDGPVAGGAGSISQMLSNIQQIITLAKGDGLTVVGVTLPVWAFGGANSGVWNLETAQDRDTFNAGFKALSGLDYIVDLDLDEILGDPASLTDLTHWQDQAVDPVPHPTAAGYARISAMLAPVIEGIRGFEYDPGDPGDPGEPTYNLALWNSGQVFWNQPTFSNGDRTVTHTLNPEWAATRGTPGVSSGKVYFEVTGTSNAFGIGVHRHDLPMFDEYPGEDVNGFTFYPNGWGAFFNDDEVGNLSGLTLPAGGGVVGIAFDLDARLVWVRVAGGNWNGSGSANPATGAGGLSIPIPAGPLTPAAEIGSVALTINSGQDAFAHTPPDGFGPFGVVESGGGTPPGDPGPGDGTGSVTTTFTHNGITGTLAAAREVLYYANGEPLILYEAGQSVSITGFNPASNTSGRIMHGAVMNYGGGADAPYQGGVGWSVYGTGAFTQGFDSDAPGPTNERLWYDNARNIDPGNTGQPIVFSGSSAGTIDKARSLASPEGSDNPAREPARVLDRTARITVGPATIRPHPDGFRPASMRTSKASPYRVSDMDLSKWPSVGPLPSGAPSVAATLAAIKGPLQVGSRYDDRQRSINAHNDQANFGRDLAVQHVDAALLCCFDIPMADKEALSIALCQRGIDIDGVLRAGGFYAERGGILAGRKLPMIVLGWLMGDQGVINRAQWAPGYPNHRAFHEDRQLFYMEQWAVDYYPNYVQADVGMPEYWIQWITDDGIVPPWYGVSGPHPTASYTGGSNYRPQNSHYLLGNAMFVLMTNTKAQWGWDVTLDYADRMQNQCDDYAADSNNSSNAPPAWHRALFANRRSDYNSVHARTWGPDFFGHR
jgi:hypothetical protein